ncbi:AAA family ATPase [Filimonas effusa]|uniref:ATPase AAA-type core domain-containing protein n=1 Tax=Filimonas effusa TaxID=2508721 RepID=A0A4Q1D7X5_9BACT|nr:AAA family ATPase [Filimonas effusa]RXK83817.1 hypothetical protein ESB13_17250 [Filimonas effusa]
MIDSFFISNYKSIRRAALSCKRINVFIGEPNSGKSNILEALSLLGNPVFTDGMLSKQILRYKTLGDIFYDFNINRPILIQGGNINTALEYAVRENGVPENEFQLTITDGKTSHNHSPFKIGHNGELKGDGTYPDSAFKYYQYKRLDNFQVQFLSSLSTPFGENLPALLLSNEDYRAWASDFFASKGFNLTLKPAENEINISKIINNAIYSYPYQSVSETLQRVVFYMMAIKSNKNAILLLDEPETNTFPFYTKFLGESMALDKANQYFITTHNPYLLINLIEKTSFEDINVCVATMNDDYTTEIITLSQTQLEQVLDLNSDVFFNLDAIID